jgi:small-conductance mechanosensitive channel
MNEQHLENALVDALHRVIGNTLLIEDIITTFVMIAIALVARTLIILRIKGRSEILSKDQRKWINRVKNSAIGFILVFLVFIWAPQIQTFALSLTAVAVAVVLTTKELLMCLTGSFMRGAAKAFHVGDWITIDDMSGEVMEINTLSTVLEELDPKTRNFTGRTLHIPNSKFLTSTVENANFLKHYIYHTITLTIPHQDSDPVALLAALEEIVEKHYTPHQKAAERFNKMVERKTAIDFADAKAEFWLRTTDQGHYTFSVKFFAPTKEFGQLEAEIAKEFLAQAHAMKVESKSKSGLNFQDNIEE